MADDANQQLFQENLVQKAAELRVSAQLQEFVQKVADSEELHLIAGTQFLPLQEKIFPIMIDIIKNTA